MEMLKLEYKTNWKMTIFILLGAILIAGVGAVMMVNNESIAQELFGINIGGITAKQTIIVTKATHLDSNRNFISDIYETVKELDNIWSPEIPDAHYVRITFEKNLTNRNDITIFPRITSGEPRIEVYEIDKTTKIAEFTSINSNQYNKIFLTNLISESQDVFDLKVIGGEIEFDHIIDPHPLTYKLHKSATSYGTATSRTVTGLNISEGDLVVVFGGTSSNATSFPLNISDSFGSNYNDVQHFGYSIYSSIIGGWKISETTNSSASVTVYYNNSGSSCRITVLVAVFEVAANYETALNFSGEWNGGYTSPPWTTSGGDTTENYTLGISFWQAAGTTYWRNQTIGGNETETIVFNESPTAMVDGFYRLYEIPDNDITAKNNNTGSTRVTGSLFVLKVTESAGEDTTPPTYSNNQHNNTLVNEATLFSILWNDNVALHPNGQYIFSTNNTGIWQNDSAINFTTTPSWANATKVLNSTVGTVVGYRWYATDNAGNPRETDIFALTTTEESVPIIASVNLNATDSPVNSTNANLTAYLLGVENSNFFTHNWKMNGGNLAVINIPFEASGNPYNATDYAGYNNNATGFYGGTPVYLPTGGVDGGGAYNFSETDSAIRLNNSGFPNIGTGNYTLEVWVKTSDSKSYATVFNFDSAVPQFYISNGGALGIWHSSARLSNTGLGINDSSWHHLVWVREGTGTNQLKFYLDGSSVGTATHDNSIPVPTNIDVGWATPYSNEDYTGLMDNLRFYNRSFSAEQVAAMYNAGVPRYNLTVSQETNAGESWSVCVIPNDGTQDGSEVCSNGVTIQEDSSDTESPQYSNLLATPSSPATYSFGQTIEFNSTWTDNTAVSTVIINFNGVNSTVSRASGTAQNGVYRFTISGLSAGGYNYYWWANDTASPANTNQTGSQSYTINQAILTGTLTNTQSWTITYPTEITIGISESNNGDSDVTYKVYRNGVDRSSGETITLGYGSYNYVLNSTGGTNYTANSSINAQTLTVNKNTGACDVLFNETSPITYPGSFRVWSNCNSAFTLYRNGSIITNNSQQNLSAGTYNFTVIRTDSQNYTNFYDEEIFVVNKATPTASLTNDRSWTFTYDGTVANIGISESNTGDGDVTYVLWKNNVNVGSSNSQAAAGTFNYKINTTGGQNYSSTDNLDTNTLTINKATSSIYTYVNNTRSNIQIIESSSIWLNATRITGDTGATLRLYRNSTLLNQGTNSLSNFTLFDTLGFYNITGFYVESENYTGSFETWYVTVQEEPDTEFPTITIHSPLSTIYNNATQLMNITAEDNIGISTVLYNWNGTNASYASEIYVEFSEGSNTLIVWANDTSGNTNSTNVTFSIDTIAPSCSVQSITKMTNTSYQHVKDNIWFYNPTYIGSVRINISSPDADVHSVIFPETVSAGSVDISFPYLHDYNWTTSSTYNGTTMIFLNDTAGNIGNCTFEIYRDTISPSYLGYNYVGGASYVDGTNYWVTGGDNYLIIINHSDAQSGVNRQYFGYNKDACTPNGCEGSPYEIKSSVANNVMDDWMVNDSYLNIVSAACQLASCYDVLNASYLWNTTVSENCEDWDYKMNTFLYDLVIQGVGYTDMGIWLKVDNTQPISTPSALTESASENFNVSVSDTDTRSGINSSLCEYKIFNSTDYTLDWTPRTCEANITIGVSYCSSGYNCTIVVRSTDNVGLVSEEENVSVFYEELDLTVPTYSNNQHNNTVIGLATLFSILWNDNTALHSSGEWIFSTNNSGTWQNDSAISFTTTPSWANVTKTLNATEGIVVGYRWYATDNAGNPRVTDIFVLTTIPVPVGSPSRIYIGSGKLSLSPGGILSLR